MRRFRLLTLLLAMALIAPACNGVDEVDEPADDPAEDAVEETEDGLVLGFSQVTLASPFYVELRDGAQEMAESLGHELIFLDADGDETRQNTDVADLITQGVDVIILNPVDPEAVAPALRDAEEAGIPVVTVDRPVETGALAHVGRDNVQMGRAVGEVIVDLFADAEAKVIEIQGDAGGIVMRDRRDGFNEAVDAAPNIEVVQGPYAEYIRAEAVTAMQDLLEAHPDVDAVYAHNDDMAVGALQVLQDAGRDDVLVAGVDGLMEAIELMAEGEQYVATSLNDPRFLGAATVEAAVAAALGEDVPEFVDAGTTVVTQENAAEFLGDTIMAEYAPDIDL